LSASARNGSRAPRSLNELTDAEIRRLYFDWRFWARDDQLPPGDATDWRVWLLLGGRGAGKTRAGAEWVRAMALGLWDEVGAPRRRIALVGETHADVRRVMIEGTSGLLAVHPDDERPVYEASNGRLVWPNGSVAHVFSAESPDSLRGPQFEFAWCDEIAKWREPDAVWDMLQFALRLGQAPRICVTTTPRPLPFLKALIADAATVTARAATMDNASHLAPGFVEEMQRRYRGTVLGRQELMGEIVEDEAGLLWRRDWIDLHRVGAAPPLQRVVVAVDPPVTATATSDACGIVVAGVAEDGRAYVLEDRSLQGREPHVWARAAVAAYHEHQADHIVAETNQGGDLVVAILKQMDEAVPVRKVTATRGKWLRAEPVAALYAEGRVAHAGRFDRLEDQMLAFTGDGRVNGRSPDRLDALVWALTDLKLSPLTRPGIRTL
jgi:predicted phage terminase large subunit-like protein